jgi:exopolyphosphatase / guanosine-5'-triphosphate,3'-diphosphate pyrophosphatase
LKLAVIDIGSNAIRFQVSRVSFYKGELNLKKVEYIRFPLRLGQDVFNDSKLSEETEKRFVKLMKAFSLLIELYEVEDYMACATSAMREAKNGEKIVRKVERKYGLKIEIINGEREAEIIDQVISPFLDERSFIHIDVGGGSTEINIYANRHKIGTRSFRLGSVRQIQHALISESLKDVQEWVGSHSQHFNRETVAIGTGGNIAKIYELSGRRENRILPLELVEQVKGLLESYTNAEREFVLNLNADRADVILPAAEIYLTAMKAAGANKIIIPDLGLKDGMINMLCQRKLEAAGFPIKL